jgi:hypothetical protein
MKFTAFEPFYSRLDMDITQEVVDIWGYYIIFYKYIMTFQSVDDIYVIITIISDHISCLIFFYESHLYPSHSLAFCKQRENQHVLVKRSALEFCCN